MDTLLRETDAQVRAERAASAVLGTVDAGLESA